MARLEPIDNRAFAAHRDQWLPLLGTEPDVPWNWPAHCRRIGTQHGALPGEDLAHCALWSDGHLEAMMIVSSAHTCVDDIHAGSDALFIEFLASAPWHRKWLHVAPPSGAYPPHAGVGACLVNEAILTSRTLGMAGRLAWDAKPTAVEKYRTMFHRVCHRPPLECGVDAGSGEVSMEIDASLAAVWQYL
ncbi:hypothetical protein [Methylorubrum aminovorans]|uniref:hypothetical protein n=1 Tax=Methylorubrum aminovorans TaxID=269069 RepID=UPI003C308103